MMRFNDAGAIRGRNERFDGAASESRSRRVIPRKIGRLLDSSRFYAENHSRKHTKNPKHPDMESKPTVGIRQMRDGQKSNLHPTSSSPTPAKLRPEWDR
jgi:hypothetical protein